MKRVARPGRRAGRGWAFALAGSFWAHTAVLGLLLTLGGRRAPVAAEPIVVELTAPPPEVTIDPPSDPLAPSLQALPDPPLPDQDEVVVARPEKGAEGSRDNAVARTLAPREADGRDRAAPAPDSGQDGGRLAAEAFRRDRSTLRSRVTDGSASSQLARLRTAHRASSPQAVRREAVTGIGDSVATVQAARAPSAAQPDTPPALAGQGPGAPPGSHLARVDRHLEIPRAGDHPSLDRGVGPLAAEAGARSFDTETRGRAAEEETTRAASNERHPRLTDFSHAGVIGPRDSLQGRGPGRAPGAVALMTSGSAPSEYGARNPEGTTVTVVEVTREREYDRYYQEFQRRIQRVLVFPKILALHLEQGETVISFAVKPDGTVGEGPRVVKSSGFQEFDAEAVKAVLRAAPYPRRADTWRGSMTVTFENPLIR